MLRKQLEQIDSEYQQLLKEGIHNELDKKEIGKVLTGYLFHITKNLGQKMVEVRDYNEIAEKGPFKYAGRIDTMYQEGLLPKEIYELFNEHGLNNHIGPSYLRVKGILTYQKLREFFGNQLVYQIEKDLKNNLPDGEVLFLPNMTGGAWIGDETRRQAEEKIKEFNIWPTTPYARGARKEIEVKSKEVKLVDHIEGLVPPPEETGAVYIFEELRTTSETTCNTARILKQHGYDKDSGVDLVAVSVYDYRHPVGVERLERANLRQIYLVDGKNFFKASLDEGFISDPEYQTGIEWLSDPWKFTEKVLS